MAVGVALDHRENFAARAESARGIHVSADRAQVVRERSDAYFGPDRAPIELHRFFSVLCHGNGRFQCNRSEHRIKIASRPLARCLVTSRHLINGRPSRFSTRARRLCTQRCRRRRWPAQGNALGCGSYQCALKGRRHPPPLQGGTIAVGGFPGRRPGLLTFRTFSAADGKCPTPRAIYEMPSSPSLIFAGRGLNPFRLKFFLPRPSAIKASRRPIAIARFKARIPCQTISETRCSKSCCHAWGCRARSSQ